jgi:acyl-CoA hydrolase
MPKTPQTITAEAAAERVKSGDWVDYGFGMGQPERFDRALAARAPDVRGVKIRSAFSMRPRKTMEVDPCGEHFMGYNWHFSGYDRARADEGRTHYVPMNFGESPDLYRRFVDPIDVVCVRTCPMDEHGWFNFSGAVTYHKAMTERAKILIVETSTAMPYVFGGEEAVHASEVDFVVDGADDPVTEFGNPTATDVDRKVAALIAAEVGDGACLQIGIGGMPNAVCALLRDAGVRDLGIHTEMLVDGMIDLVDAGIVTGARKRIDRGKIVFTFAAGSRKQYDYIHRNPALSARPVDYTNLPHNIMQNDDVVSINNTTQVDLQGQAASESSGHRHISGTGGQLQFVRGAYASRGGKSFICLSSTYERHGRRESRIVPTLTHGNIVTTPRTDVMYVVTEYGLVNLKGKSVAERAKALITLAHPDFREQLERDAREKKILPPSFC